MNIPKSIAKKLGYKFNPHQHVIFFSVDPLDLAKKLYLLGFQVPDITPSPFGISVFMKNLDKQLHLYIAQD